VIFRGVMFTLLATALPGSCLGFKHAVGVAPSPRVALYPTPGTYTIAATTVTLISASTVCAATTTSLAPGTQTVGAVTLLFPVPPPSPCHMPVSGRNREPSPVRSIRPRFSVRPPALTQLVQPHSYRITIYVYPVPASYTPGTYTRPRTVVTTTETSDLVVCPFAPPTLSSPPPCSLTASTTAASSPSSTSASMSASAATSSTPVPTPPYGRGVWLSTHFNSQSVTSRDVVWLSAVFKPKFS
jgi:hypothetical protein